MACANDDPPKHDHRPEFILAKTQNIKKDWKKLLIDIETASRNAREWFEENNEVYKGLVEYETT